MRCIFCKQDSSPDRSIEHILPESLGNTEHTLPCGVVCDQCNNYFSRKIEGPLLASGMFRLLRAERGIQSKRGRIPILPDELDVELPPWRTMGRFLAKVGLEVLAERLLDVPEWNSEIVDKIELDELRRYARFNEGEDWPFTHRTLYPVNAVFREGDAHYEMLHEYDLLYTTGKELYLVLAILGEEFAINLGGREMEGYRSWLEKNEGVSHLYSPKVPERNELEELEGR